MQHTTAAAAPPSAPKSWEDLGFRTDRLRRNLDALAAAQPELAAWLEGVGIHGALTIASDEGGRARVHRVWRRKAVAVEELEDELATPAPEITADASADHELLVGVGTGERAWRLARRTGAPPCLLLHEPDPSLATLALARHDWSEAIGRRRVRLLVGSDLRAEPLPALRRVFVHPRLAPLYRHDLEFVQRAGAARLPRAAVLAGELLQDELMPALREQGLDAVLLDADVLTADQLARELVRLDAAAVFSINFVPELAELGGRLGIPYAAWEIDPTASTLPAFEPGGPAARYSFVFTWRTPRVASFRRAGLRHVRAMPLAADPERRAPAPTSAQHRPGPEIVFAGSCLRRTGREHRELLERAIRDGNRALGSWRAFLDEVDALCRDVERRPCRDDVEDCLRDALTRRGLPDRIETPAGEADVVVLAGEELAAAKRRAIVQALAHEGLVVFGEPEWRDTVPEADFRGPAGYDELTRIYRTAAVNVDINRIYQPDIVTLRVFEVAACGGLVLTERGDALSGVFRPGTEVETYATPDELVEKARFFRDHPEQARAIGARARARLLTGHTVEHRVREMLGTLEAAGRLIRPAGAIG